MSPLVGFIASSISLLVFIALVAYERKKPSRIYRTYRAQADRVLYVWIARIAQWVHQLEGALSPTFIMRSVVRMTAHTVAVTAKFVEKKARHITRAMTHHDASRGSIGTRSMFLQKVQEHKKSLNTEEVKRFHRVF